MVSFLEKLIEVDCDESRRPLSQVAESRRILPANIFSAHGVPIGAESARRSSPPIAAHYAFNISARLGTRSVGV
jgi:hypothetical protein